MEVTVYFKDAEDKTFKNVKGAQPAGESWFAVTDREDNTTVYNRDIITFIEFGPDMMDKMQIPKPALLPVPPRG